MNEKQEEKDQAQNLRNYKEEDGFGKEDLDVLDLPPRKDVHNTSPKTKWKFSTIWLRFLLVIFIILISLILSYQYWDDWFEDTFMEPAIIQEESPLHEEVTVERGS